MALTATFTTALEAVRHAADRIGSYDGFFRVTITPAPYGNGCTVTGTACNVMWLIGEVAAMGEDGLVDVTRATSQAAA